MADVRSKIDVTTVSDPLQRVPDPWADFRQVERITLELTQQYQHSLGKLSRFFIGLENREFLATQCPACARTYAPPRPWCPHCAAITHWRPLLGTGTVETYSVLHFGSGVNADVSALPTPYVLAYVLLDGASTLFPHLLKLTPDRVRIGLRVRVAYTDGPVTHPIHLMYFEEA